MAIAETRKRYRCHQCASEAVKLPVVVAPLVGWPIPAYLHMKWGLCQRHANAFNIDNFGDFMGSWYEMLADHVREQKKPAINPFPEDPKFTATWETFIVDPHYHVVPREQCVLQMWDLRVMEAAGLKQKLW